MNFKRILEQAAVVFLFVFSHVITPNSVEAGRAVRIVTKNFKSPLHVHAFSGSTYARRYGYGSPLGNYGSRPKYGRNKKFFGRRNGRLGARNYAYRYRNWSPNRPYIHDWKYNPRIDGGKRRPQKMRKEPYPFHYYENSKQKRKERPNRINHLQRPKPPKPSHDFDEDYYFPEEAVRPDTKYEMEIGYGRPKRKRKNPAEVEKILTRQEYKTRYQREKPENPHKPKPRRPSISYSNFVQHISNDDEYYDEDVDGPEYAQQATKIKKKTVKKKSNSRKKSQDPDYHSEREEQYEDEYRSTEKNFKKNSKKPQVADEEDHSSTSRPNRVNSDDYRKGNRGNQNHQELPPVPNNPPPWPQPATHPMTYDNRNSFQPQQFTPNPYSYQTIPSQYSYQNRDFSSFQVSHAPSSNANHQSNYYPQPENNYKPISFGNSYPNSPPPLIRPQLPYNYETYSNNIHSHQQPSSTGYENKISASKNRLAFDSPQIPYDYNSNSFPDVKSQSLSFLDNGPKYGNRLSAISQSTGSQRAVDENDFLKKHQNLYNKGVSGIPIQGDGYGKETSKEYDIGYGDFQFDQVPGTN